MSADAGARAEISALAELVRSRSAGHLVLLLDYDGTLVAIAERPELAPPDPPLLSLLERLCARPATSVHIVSGRPRDVLFDWLGHLPLALWAEHGAFFRAARSREWSCPRPINAGWELAILPLLEAACRDTPGSFIERKTATVAWHYRQVAGDRGEQRARELAAAVTATAGAIVDVIDGKKVVEARIKGLTKALAAEHVLRSVSAPRTVFAIGDDVTDEDLFAGVGEQGITVAVGPHPSGAQHRVRDTAQVRELLHGLTSWTGQPR
jgi:trehalose 6-phosphate synthase/phosphatase